MNVHPTPVQPNGLQPHGLTLGDIYYVLFRHKWKLLFCVTTALAAAGYIYFTKPSPYLSEAKLYIRYVVADKAIGPTVDRSAKSPDQRGETIMNSEKEILTSVDLMRRVVETVGAQRILGKAGGGNDTAAALAIVRRNLTVIAPRASSIMHVSFKHSDPELVQPLLRELVQQYLRIHVETHTANGMLGEFLTQETDQLRSKLAQTEDELRKATARAGVVSLEEAKKSYADQMAGIRRELYSVEAEIAEKSSALEELKKRVPVPDLTSNVSAPVPPEVLAEYRSVSNQVDLLIRIEQELLTQFTAESPRVIEVKTQRESAEKRRAQFHERYPRIQQVGISREQGPANDAAIANDLVTQIVARNARTAVLQKQLAALRAEATKLDSMEGTIVELRRKKELEEANYRYYAASLEQARINETLGNGRISNIIQVQTPSPPFRDRTNTMKTSILILIGGIGGALAWAFFIELYLDRTVKRPVDVLRATPAPLLISIPKLRRKQLSAGANGHHNGSETKNGSPQLAITPANRPLVIYHETLRDRLIGYFESLNLTHKPKLIAVTGLSQRSGVTTTASGLARSLSETGEGNVLLVDMNADTGMAQQFAKGRAVCGLDQLLETRDGAHVEQNLYVVAENSHSDRLSRNLPQRFTKLIPKLKASDFDYIIFDMPPVSQISITPRLAGFMDLVLLVVESEKTERDLVRGATRLLAESRARLGVVLNKTRNYVPSRLHDASLSN